MAPEVDQFIPGALSVPARSPSYRSRAAPILAASTILVPNQNKAVFPGDLLSLG